MYDTSKIPLDIFMCIFSTQSVVGMGFTAEKCYMGFIIHRQKLN